MGDEAFQVSGSHAPGIRIGNFATTKLKPSRRQRTTEIAAWTALVLAVAAVVLAAN